MLQCDVLQNAGFVMAGMQRSVNLYEAQIVYDEW